MPISRELLIRIIAGLLTSGIFCYLLAQQIMAGGVGTSISFWEFIKVPGNGLFCLLMAMFVFASWLMKGINNRVVLFCWAIVIILHHVIYWWLYDYFYHQFHNIYVLNLAGPVATLPAVLFLRYRVTYSVFLTEKLWLFGILKSEANNYLQNAKVTDFELHMKQAMYSAFIVEFLYAVYLSAYSLIYQIPVSGSVYEHLMDSHHWDPFYLYHALINIITFGYILIICFYLFRDRHCPDGFLHGASQQDRQAIAQEMLLDARHAKQTRERKKRDQD